MNGLFAILIFVFFIYAIAIFCTVIVYGKPVNDNEIIQAINKNLDGGIRINSFNKEIFYIGKMPYISKLPLFAFPFCFEINEIGIVPIWSKSYKLLNEIDKKLDKDRKKARLKKLGL